MANLRKVTISSTRREGARPFTVDTTADTWGVLRLQLAADESFDSSNLTIMLRELGVEIESDDYTLPAGDFSLVLFPQESLKAGK